MLEASLGTAQHHENLTLFPILAEKPREVAYGLMAEALALGILTIREKNGGEVPLLLATNAGPHPILILDGEQLIGAKQNRMTNRTILLAPNSMTEIPVSCMEQGRWHHQTDHFSPAPQHAPSKVRRKARETENRASYMAEARGPEARSSHRDLAQAQGEVWEEIRGFEERLGTSSETGALNTMYEERRDRMGEWVRAFPLVEGQIGLAAFQGTAPLALDALESPSVYGKIHERLLTGYILDAMESWHPEQPSARPSQADAERFMTALGEAERVPSLSVGSGDYRILRGKVLGGELVNDQQLVHVSAFPAIQHERGLDGGPEGVQGGPRRPRARPIARPSRRRRGF
jgi:hypothetical protein